MKKTAPVKILVLLLLTAFATHAQIPKGMDTAMINQKIREAQAMMSKSLSPAQQKQLQQAMQNARQQIKKTGVKDVNGKDVTDSVIGAIKTPDPGQIINNMSSGLKANYARLQQLQSANKQAITQGLPQRGTAAFAAMPDAQKETIVGYARAIIASVTPKLNLMHAQLKKSIDDVLKDSTITPQAQGIQMMAAGAPMEVVKYMVAMGVIRQPSNPWAANTLGVMMRNDLQYKEAIQCFRYAYWINPCGLIKCNLAWAIGYYGDFATAKKLFNEVLAITPHYRSALEGLGMIAYQEGDTATLFQCLAAQLNPTGFGGPDEPSDSFMSFCDGVNMDNVMANVGRQQVNGPGGGGAGTGGGGINGSGESRDNQDPPAGGHVQYPSYPTLGGLFAQNVDDLMNAVLANTDAHQKINNEKKASAENVYDMYQHLSKLDERPYTDADGLRVTPFRYSKFNSEFHAIRAEFTGRVSYVMKQYYDERSKLINSIAANTIEFHKNYTNALMSCAGDTACLNNINCEWKQKARSMLGSELTGASVTFSTYFAQLTDQINWYIDASTPAIKHMLKPDWNQYLNAERLDDISQTVLNIYDGWIVTQGFICQAEQINLAFMPLTCTTQLRTPGEGSTGAGLKPTQTEFNKFETPPLPCEKIFNCDMRYKYASIHRDCNGTRVAVYPIVTGGGGSLDAGPLHGSLEAQAKLGFVMQTIAKTGETRLGTTANVTVEATLTASVKDGDKLTKSDASASAGVSAKAEANYDSTIIIGNDGSITGRAKSADFQAMVEAKADASISNPLGAVKANAEWKAEAKGQIDVSTVAGSKDTYNINNASFSASHSSSSSSHLPGQ